MKTLSIHAPWAWAIIAGIKRFENRSRRFNYRGPLAIHASLSRASDQFALALMEKQGITPPSLETLDSLRGRVIGTVELVDCLDYETAGGDGRRALAMHQSPWASGPFCLVLENPAKCVPIAAKGALSLWTCKAELVLK